MTTGLNFYRYTTAALCAVLLMAAALSHRPERAVAGNVKQARITYSRDIAPIIDQNCASCHHAGQVAPFTLTSYADVSRKAETIAAVTSSGYMPPWHAAPGAGDFSGARTLSPQQVVLLKTWADQGAPEGDPAAIPPLPHYASGWMTGAPNAVYQPDRPYKVLADGPDVYRCFVIPTSYADDRYISAIEVHPGNGKVVHHVIAYLDTTGKARALAMAANDSQPGYTSFGGPGFTVTGALGGWAPGNEPYILPAGVGIFLPKGADIVLQVHYHSDGKPETDLTKIGLYFSRQPVDKRVRVLPVVNPAIRIPAGDAHYTARCSVVLPANITVLAIMPHMHLLGHSMSVNAVPPSGAVIPMIDVPDWDFNWQTTYVYKQPLHLAEGTRIRLAADYDNSSGNPRNPNNPPKLVTWGEQTTDEMCIAFVFYTVDEEHLTQGIVSPVGDYTKGGRHLLADFALQIFDKDEDNKLDVNELAVMIDYMRAKRSAQAPQSAPPGDDSLDAARRLIKAFDRDGDGKLDKTELENMISLIAGN